MFASLNEPTVLAARALTVFTGLAPHRTAQRCAPIPVRSVTTPSPQVHPQWVRTRVCRTGYSRQSRLAPKVCRHGSPDSDHGGAPPTRSFPTWDAWHPMQRTRRLRRLSAAKLLPSCLHLLAVSPPKLQRSPGRHTCQTSRGVKGDPDMQADRSLAGPQPPLRPCYRSSGRNSVAEACHRPKHHWPRCRQ